MGMMAMMGVMAMMGMMAMMAMIGDPARIGDPGEAKIFEKWSNLDADCCNLVYFVGGAG